MTARTFLGAAQKKGQTFGPVSFHPLNQIGTNDTETDLPTNQTFIFHSTILLIAAASLIS